MTAEERIAVLEARLAAAEARVATLEAARFTFVPSFQWVPPAVPVPCSTCGLVGCAGHVTWSLGSADCAPAFTIIAPRPGHESAPRTSVPHELRTHVGPCPERPKPATG